MNEFSRVCEACTARSAREAPGVPDELEQRVLRAEAEVSRLALMLRLRDEQVHELRMALAHSASLHFSVQQRLERELDSHGRRTSLQPAQVRAAGQPGDGQEVVVQLPYMTSVLEVLHETMRTFWAGRERDDAPKSSTVARAIDRRLNLRTQADGEASRSGQAYAAAIRPDWIRQDDNRHHRRRLCSEVIADAGGLSPAVGSAIAAQPGARSAEE